MTSPLLLAAAALLGPSGWQQKSGHIKVFVLTRVNFVEKGADGVYRQRRGSIDDAKLQSVRQEIESFKASVSGSNVSVTVDDDPVVEKLSSEDPAPLGPDFVSAEVLPRYNPDPFKTDSGTYWGPFDAVFVLHAGLTKPSWTANPNGTPIHLIAMNRVNPGPLAQGLGAAMKAVLDGKPAESVFTSEPNNWVVTKQAGPEGTSMQFTLDAQLNYGRATLAQGADATDLAAKGFSVSVKSEGNDAVALVFKRGTKPVAIVMLAGSSTTAIEEPRATLPVFDARVPVDGAVHKIAVPAIAEAAGADTLELATPPGGWAYDRPDRQRRMYQISMPVAGGTGDRVAKPEGPDPLVRFAEIKDPLTPESTSELVSTLTTGSETEVLNATMALTRTKAPGAVPGLIEIATGLSPGMVMAGALALAHQGTPEALAALKAAAEHGPYDINRRFAAHALAPLEDKSMSASFNMMTARSAHARLEGALALARIQDESAKLILISLLVAEPEPFVRLVVAQKSDVTLDLVARRLLFLGVNDESQAVRVAALVNMLDCPFDRYRNEAIKGVSDEAKGVRLGLLRAMAAKPNESFRSALRTAVADLEPEVRAAALDAFATIPGPVTAQEVQNTFKDKDVRVQEALARLARAKGIQVPPL